MAFTSRFAFHRHRAVAAVAVTVVALVGLNVFAPVEAQTTPVELVFVLPAGSNATQLPLGAQSFQLQVKNVSAAAVTSVQVVVRVPPPPAYVVSVTESGNAIGLVDNRSGFWYHTIAQIAPSSTVTLAVSWQMACPGKWPITARVGTTKAAIAPTWVGPPNSQCGPDENASPAPASYYELPWPPSVVGAAPTASPSTTTILGQVVATTAPLGVPAATVFGATTTTLVSLLATSTTANIQPIGAVTSTTLPIAVVTAATSTTKAVAVTAPSVTTTTEPLVEIAPDTTATTVKKSTSSKSSSKSASSSKTSSGTGSKTSTTVITICKTIGGKRYCGPASSVYKPGQKKAVESKPKKTTKTH